MPPPNIFTESVFIGFDWFIAEIVSAFSRNIDISEHKWCFGDRAAAHLISSGKRSNDLESEWVLVVATQANVFCPSPVAAAVVCLCTL